MGSELGVYLFWRQAGRAHYEVLDPRVRSWGTIVTDDRHKHDVHVTARLKYNSSFSPEVELSGRDVGGSALDRVAHPLVEGKPFGFVHEGDLPVVAVLGSLDEFAVDERLADLEPELSPEEWVQSVLGLLDMSDASSETLPIAG